MIDEPITVVDLECSELRRISTVRREIEKARRETDARRERRGRVVRAVLLAAGAAALVVFGGAVAVHAMAG